MSKRIDYRTSAEINASIEAKKLKLGTSARCVTCRAISAKRTMVNGECPHCIARREKEAAELASIDGYGVF